MSVTLSLAAMSELDGWRFCARCGSEVERGKERVRCSACGFIHYANSEPTACALCVDERGRVLLARRANEPFKGYWDLPGGFLEEGEHPLDALRRELREETGLEVEPLEFVGIWMDRYPYGTQTVSTLNLYWTARVVRGSPAPADDVSELEWFAAGKFPPEDELAFHIADVLRTWRDEYA
jgi:8-oxo-dGTP diphosphatase